MIMPSSLLRRIGEVIEKTESYVYTYRRRGGNSIHTDTMSTSGDISRSSTTKCGEIGGGNDDDKKKTSTSYEQKSKISGGDSSSSISHGDAIDDALSNGLEELDISDNKLFQDPPPTEDCSICFLPMPHILDKTYMPCCGKTLCDGCVVAAQAEMEEGNIKRWCPFCRLPIPKSDKELVQRYKKRMKLKDAYAFQRMGCAYADGEFGLTQNVSKAFELYKQAAEHGSVSAHCSLGAAYLEGEGVDEDLDKAKYHYELAAIGGHEAVRYSLGTMEEYSENMDRAMKHYMIAARCGYDDSLKKVGDGYKAGHVTKDEYASTLRSYQETLEGMKSEQRDKASKKLKSN